MCELTLNNRMAEVDRDLCGQPIPVPDHPFRKVVFPNVQPEPSLAQLEAIPSSPITSHMREEANPQLTTTSDSYREQ